MGATRLSRPKHEGGPSHVRQPHRPQHPLKRVRILNPQTRSRRDAKLPAYHSRVFFIDVHGFAGASESPF